MPRRPAPAPALNRRALLATGLATVPLAAGPRAAGAAGPPPAPPYAAEPDGTLVLGPRRIPLPPSISEEAKAGMRAAAQAPWTPLPPASDRGGWALLAERIASADAAKTAEVDRRLVALDVHVETRPLGEATLFIAAPRRASPRTLTRIMLEIHGGGLIAGGGNGARFGAAVQAAAYDCMVWGVDYRMPPAHPYPAPLDDCLAAYREMLKVLDPRRIIVHGVSAGGNLAAATVLRARDEGLPMPRAAALLTPELDLTESGDTFETNRWIDVALKTGLGEANRVYAAGHDLAHPYLSPLFGDFRRGFPPTFLSAGTRDLFLSNAVRMQRSLRRAGIPCDLQLWEGMPHGGFADSPEMSDLQREVRHFLDVWWGG
ncbi:alpha/beta hydrolase [Roseomonas sp. OT10]|uniref:alpha/beta hydrolase n=1 Tax=Roseomonas cutis TaxID=2897332 RepID=UPI001E2D9BA4|nr:alpha/beta hydrolase [Roseomonas sp. OT10]UFN48239.1 alpha/beta hydrolase [Roseomonas sp. OT10]